MENLTENPYHNSKIYKIVEDETGLFYIGSTFRSLSRRYQDHKDHSKNKSEYKIYKFFTHDKFESGSLKIELIKEISVENNKELRQIEDSYIQECKNNILCLNTKGATLNYPQKTKNRKKYLIKYYALNKENLNEKSKKFYYEKGKKHRQILSALKNELRQNFKSYCEVIDENFSQYKVLVADLFNEESKKIIDQTKKIINDVKEKRKKELKELKIIKRRENYRLNDEYKNRQKIYRDERKDIRKDYDVEYRKKNAEKIKTRASKQIICCCGCIITKQHMKRHEITKNIKII